MGTNNFKKELLSFCDVWVQERLDRIETQIKDIKEALNSETKSTAGDKHETGRAMLQLEREKMGVQLAEAQKLQAILAKINVNHSNDRVSLGSWVKTSQHTYFISISIGKIKVSNMDCFAIAANTPIGKLLLGKKVDDTFVFQGKEIEVLEVE